jgi:hypothetical protein
MVVNFSPPGAVPVWPVCFSCADATFTAGGIFFTTRDLLNGKIGREFTINEFNLAT